jgi:serine-type D-Ala-D-Ala carboxypeptidase (penicillin-binding protein 5/6)
MIKEGDLDRQSIYNCEVLTRLLSENESGIGIYLHEMNANARKLGLSRSTWANPHGLSNVNNMSTAEDIAKLCMHCMKNGKFREVVNTKFYNCCFFQEKEGGIEKGWLKWENTNKMLWQGWDGIKTGVTPNAGPCLAASTTRAIAGREYEFLVVLLCSDSMEVRWKEVKDLIDWIVVDPSLY